MMLAAPIPAAKKALKNAGLSARDIDLYEINEAFASIPLAVVKELGLDLNKLNVNGGAMALGHPLGGKEKLHRKFFFRSLVLGTGTKLVTTLLHELERRRQRYGLLSICEGMGTANAMVIERIESAKL